MATRVQAYRDMRRALKKAAGVRERAVRKAVSGGISKRNRPRTSKRRKKRALTDEEGGREAGSLAEVPAETDATEAEYPGSESVGEGGPDGAGVGQRVDRPSASAFGGEHIVYQRSLSKLLPGQPEIKKIVSERIPFEATYDRTHGPSTTQAAIIAAVVAGTARYTKFKDIAGQRIPIEVEIDREVVVQPATSDEIIKENQILTRKLTR